MRQCGINFKNATWVALLALLMQALLPAMLRGVPMHGEIPLEICTAFGIKKLESKNTDPLPNSGKHCVACALADSFALPATAPSMHADFRLAFSLPHPGESQEYTASHLVFHPRGPPTRT